MVLQSDHALRIVGHGACGPTNVRKQPGEPLPGKQREDDLNAQVGLKRRDLSGVEKPLQIGRGGIRRIQLRKRGREEEDGGLQCG